MAKEVVSGTHKTGIGNWDGMHKFASQDSSWAGLHGWSQFGTKGGGGKLGKALQAFYKNYNLNPCITSVKLTVDPKKFTVDYEFTIEESPDGNAYVCMSSWGGASGGYPTKKPPGNWAYTNYKKEYDGAKKYHKDTIIKDVIDFYFPGGFRQIFFQFTYPEKFPNLPKSPDLKVGTVGVKIGPSGSPTGLPEYNGILVETVVRDIQPDVPPVPEPPVVTPPAPEPPPVPEVSTISLSGVTGKLLVKKKSGPGEITGIVEGEIVNDNVVFKDLQFTDPGLYVITISHGESSTLVDPIDISIEVLPEEVVIPQEESKGVETDDKITGNRPIIAQIDKPEIVIKEMVQEKDKLAGENNQASTTQDLGFKPYLEYNGSTISESDISSLILYHDGILPKIKFNFKDTKGIIAQHEPMADSTMELFLNPGSSNLKPIHFVFNLLTCVQIQKTGSYDATGTIYVPDLYKVNNNSYMGTSFEAIRKICKELKLGFNSNINTTNDEMSWRNPLTKPHEFIEEIIAHSYIDDEAYMGGYIDYYYCFNYVDIEKEMKRDISKDVGIDTAGMSKAGTSDELSRIQTMILSNDKSLKESAFYFENYTKKNDSTKKAVANGLLTVTKAYDRITKSFLVFNVDSTTSDGSKTIPMKGAENDKTEFDTNIRTKYTGKIDTDNVHKNYNYAITQNRINLNELNKIVLEISMPNPNFNLYKFQKVNVQITNPTTTPANPEEINFRYSGDYIILDINYLWMKGKLSQKVKLVRKEMGKKPEEMTDPKPLEKKKEVKEINENPVGATPSVVLPNSIYTPGESYVVKDKDGKKYIVTIKSLSEDGKEVLADVKQIDGADVSLQGPGATDPNGPGGSTTGTPSVAPGLSSSSTTTPGPNGSSVININWWN